MKIKKEILIAKSRGLRRSHVRSRVRLGFVWEFANAPSAPGCRYRVTVRTKTGTGVIGKVLGRWGVVAAGVWALGRHCSWPSGVCLSGTRGILAPECLRIPASGSKKLELLSFETLGHQCY